MKTYFRTIFLGIVLGTTLLPTASFAQQNQQEEILQARVIKVVSEEQIEVPATHITTTLQTLEIEPLNNPSERVTIQNDYIVLEEGDKIFVRATPDENGEITYSIVERNRISTLLIFLGLFVVAILVFGKKQGLRSLLSLAGSMFILAYVLIPSLMKGVNPVAASTIIAALILFVAIYSTHGFKKESTVAFTGTVIAVVITSIISLIAVKICHFTGLGSEEANLLNIQSTTRLNFSGLLLGGIIIGILGVLDDIAITQASVVRELYSSAAHLTKKQIYTKALRVGQEHVGALVNTLALAYTGASLPILLLFSTSTYPLALILSQEIFAVEIIRTIVGSIGLVLTVPITTLLAAHMLEHYRGKEYSHDHHGHSHSHSH